jgi:hypothetical protein
MIRIFDILRSSIFSRLLKSNVTPLSTSLLTGQSGKDWFPLLPDWPPPPCTLGLFIFPIVLEVWTRKTDLPLPVPSQAQAAADRGSKQANNWDGATDDDPDDDNVAGDVAAATENTIHISGTSLGRPIGGALIIPLISTLMGSLLFWLSLAFSAFA